MEATEFPKNKGKIQTNEITQNGFIVISPPQFCILQRLQHAAWVDGLIFPQMMVVVVVVVVVAATGPCPPQRAAVPPGSHRA